MQTEQIPKEMIKLWKSSWEDYQKAAEAVSEQGEKFLELIVKQGDDVREESRKIFQEWAAKAKELQGKYKQSIEETIKKFEEML